MFNTFTKEYLYLFCFLRNINISLLFIFIQDISIIIIFYFVTEIVIIVNHISLDILLILKKRLKKLTSTKNALK